ncbi:hypothetical protein Psal006b_02998 [Piscirickettsia salmonis]|nr:hypothetical protein Psal006b_02998 [Piscirickettsia salmonis]QGO14248.1 hypothetical protein Psal010b_02991 [Piscirickettsia salmonis]QGO67967.1 hypothetical protein Psal073_02966 [Piscirickettsia salmonis]QGO71472.1 hypothetical protein Psal081_02978 [Piscirickettsia salmonis]QGO85365.1 hypothetical protein Psal108_02991 [Piscirickettsia salmonis]
MTETTLTQTTTHYSTTSDKQVELLIFTLKNQQDYVSVATSVGILHIQ